MLTRCAFLLLLTVVLANARCRPAAAQEPPDKDEPAPTPDTIAAFEEQRTNEYAADLEAYLSDWLVDRYPERAAQAWQRDYASVEAFLASVEPNRQRWRDVIKPPELPRTGSPSRREHPVFDGLEAYWVTVPLGPLTAEGVLAFPRSASPERSAPLVLAQHGIGSNPERVFGLLDDPPLYHSYGRALIDAGFCVLAPMNLRSVERRNRIERLCRLADMSLPGLELVRAQHLLDEALADPRIDAERAGMWGISLGGMATMFWMPLEPRLKVGVVTAWFNHRRNKMAIPGPRYSCFLDTKEEHAFFTGWLTEFSDCDAASLICPRPLLIQTGKEDGIAHWPQVIEEFERAKRHYANLGMAERARMDLHGGGHEIRLESGLDFLRKWLMEP